MENLRRFVAAAAVVLAGMVGSIDPASAGYTRLVVFGDSLSDNGNLFAATGQPPAPYFQGRFSNGPVAVERMSTVLGAPLNDFAFGGAQTGAGGVSPGIPGMLTQVSNYLQSRTVDPGGLYMLWAGPNDFLSGLSAPGFNAAAAIGNAVQNIVTAATQLAQAGVRQLFIPNMVDLGITARVFAVSPSVPEALVPAVRAAQIAGANQLSVAFNTVLANALAQLSGSLSARITQFDAYGVSRNLYANAAQLGITTTTVPCFTGTAVCANPNQFFFWDDVHPTAVVHAAFGSLFAAAVVPEPATWALMLAGLVVLGAVSARRRVAQARLQVLMPRIG